MDRPELRPRRRRLASIASESLTQTYSEPKPKPRDTTAKTPWLHETWRAAIATTVVVALFIVGGVTAISRLPTQQEQLLDQTPWCPQAGTYSWSIDVDSNDPGMVAFAERLLMERNWTHVESHDLGHIRHQRSVNYPIHRIPQTTITGRCIPGVYDPTTGRIMEAA